MYHLYFIFKCWAKTNSRRDLQIHNGAISVLPWQKRQKMAKFDPTQSDAKRLLHQTPTRTRKVNGSKIFKIICLKRIHILSCIDSKIFYDFQQMKIFCVRDFFSWNLISKIGVKINSRIITKNHASDPEIRFLTKSIPKPQRPCRHRGS